MEEEIPMALEIIGKGIKQHESGEAVYKMGHILLSSILRLAVGYLFLATLFLQLFKKTMCLIYFSMFLVCELSA
jgi:hypothetical protein